VIFTIAFAYLLYFSKNQKIKLIGHQMGAPSLIEKLQNTNKFSIFDLLSYQSSCFIDSRQKLVKISTMDL